MSLAFSLTILLLLLCPSTFVASITSEPRYYPSNPSSHETWLHPLCLTQSVSSHGFVKVCFELGFFAGNHTNQSGLSPGLLLLLSASHPSEKLLAARVVSGV